MSYEIPSELQYHERIVFGLTMPQMAAAGGVAWLGWPGGCSRYCSRSAAPEILRKGRGKAYQPLDLSD